ncbi:MAG: acyl carrier protein [Bacteroidales bacterium]|nr:acyl carrier protein [Bacteroidales bacterium]MBR6929718.1 acyl carrier protein [Bacteroidales bacterium]
MTNLEKYNEVFKKMFNVPEDQLETLAYKDTAEWNSMTQIALVAELEDKFDLDFDTDDIFQLKSYVIGRKLLETKFKVEF